VNQEESEQNEVDRTKKDLMFFSSDDLGNLVNGGRYCHQMTLLYNLCSNRYQQIISTPRDVFTVSQQHIATFVYISAY